MIWKKLRQLDDDPSLGNVTLLLGALVLLSRLSGLAIKMLLASYFAPGDTLDIYVTAFRIPDIFYNLLILGTLSAAFIPVFGGYITNNKAAAFRLANTILNLAFLGMAGVCLVLFIFAEPLTAKLVPGFSPEKLAETVRLTRILLLSPLIFTVSNVFYSVLSTMKKFLIANIAPLFYNLGIIVGIVFLYPVYGLAGLGAGVIFGALLHLLIQIPEAYRNGFRWQPVLELSEPVRRVFSLFLPRVLTLDLSFASLIISTVAGSYLASGTISIYTLAHDLQAVPIGIFAISTAVAAFPLMTEAYSHNNRRGLLNVFKGGLVQILFFLIPISVLMILFRAHAVRILYGHGKFSWPDTILTFNVLGILAFALLAQSLVPLLARTFYACHNTKTPFAIGTLAIMLNAGLAFLLTPTMGVLGIALSFTAASVFQALALFIYLHRFLRKQGHDMDGFDQEVFVTVIKVLVASIVMGAVSYGLLYAAAPFLNTRTLIGIVLQVSIAVAGGSAAFVLLAHQMKLKQAQKIMTFARRFGKFYGPLAYLNRGE